MLDDVVGSAGRDAVVDVPILEGGIDSAETAAQLLFAGSPTILVDGVDLFPTGGRTSDLACRIYLTPNSLAGAPTQQQIEAALGARG